MEALADGVFWQQKLVLPIFQLAGWNVNWEKTVSIPSQSLLYQGFIMDTTVCDFKTVVTKFVEFSTAGEGRSLAFDFDAWKNCFYASFSRFGSLYFESGSSAAFRQSCCTAWLVRISRAY